jgi:lysophospholipase L1-like esterase
MAFARYVALGDSFTEGVGDPDPTRPNGLRGWADRVAEALAAQTDDFRYANLAIRGRKLPQILGEQLDAALALEPDLVTIHAGGNDVLRPSVDVDELAASYDDAVGRLAATGATIVMFTLGDTRSNQAFKVIRGRVALYNEWVREIADRHGARLIDLWRDHDYDRRHFLDVDRLHYGPAGHQMVAIRVLEALGVLHTLEPLPAPPPVALTARQRRAEHVEWTRTFLLPWVQRRLTGRSSGDGVSPKYADLTPLPMPARH